MLIEDKDIVASPVVSVIVATYNQARFISQCIDSILSQQFEVPYELIIAEDGGSDDTKEICIQYQKKHPKKIRLLLQEKNKGISGNYYDLLSLARGKYIAQVAGDDFWCNVNKLQIQYDYMETHPNCGLCYTDVKACDAQGKIIKEHYLNKTKLSRTFEEHLLRPMFLAPLTWMFKRNVRDMYQDMGYTDESVAMALDAFANYDVTYLDVCTGVYRQTLNSASSFITPNYYFKQNLGVWETQLYYADKYNCSEALKEKIRLRGYLELLPIAIMTQNDRFIEEVRQFTESIGIDVTMIIRELEQGEMRKRSKAYRLGKVILKPFKWLNEKLYGR